jgi:hypothetical protein
MSRLLLILFFLVSLVAEATAACTGGTLPFNLTNGTTADASQVMANYNAIISSVNTNCAGKGANNDITALLALTTPLAVGSGGSSSYIANPLTSTGSANAYVVAAPVPSGFSLTQVGTRVLFVPVANNTGASTLNVNGTGVQNILKITASGTLAALTGGELSSGQLTEAFWDGVEYEILPPLAVTAGFAISVTGGSLVAFVGCVEPTSIGFSTPTNLKLSVTVASNNLTVAIKTGNQVDPSPSNPVCIPFQDITSGTPVLTQITSAFSYSINSGSTMGCVSNVTCRIWIIGEIKSNIFHLALINASTGNQVFPIVEDNAGNTACNGCGTASTAGVFYSDTGVGADATRILGFAEFTEATAGVWATPPGRVKLFGPGVKKPGDVVQVVYVSSTTNTSTTSASYVITSPSASIAPTSSPNLMEIIASGSMGTTASATGEAQIFASTGAVACTAANGTRVAVAPNAVGSEPTTLYMFDQPGNTTVRNYVVCIKSLNAATIQWCDHVEAADVQCTLVIKEIMGSLEPANDNLEPLRKAA